MSSSARSPASVFPAQSRPSLEETLPGKQPDEHGYVLKEELHNVRGLLRAQEELR